MHDDKNSRGAAQGLKKLLDGATGSTLRSNFDRPGWNMQGTMRRDCLDCNHGRTICQLAANTILLIVSSLCRAPASPFDR